ncbi:MAG: threonine/serine exporter family protein [Oscillospiraceae bacterium]
MWTYYLGNLMAAAGFAASSAARCAIGSGRGLSGLIIGFVTRCMDRLEVSPFFSTIAASFLMALPAYVAAGLGWLDCVAVVIIGALMLLVPGLLITNSMRDIIYGDTELRRQPHRAGAALGVRHRAWHGGGVARHDADLRTCGGGCGADLSALGAGDRNVFACMGFVDPV